jgi:hypothetical protein
MAARFHWRSRFSLLPMPARLSASTAYDGPSDELAERLLTKTSKTAEVSYVDSKKRKDINLWVKFGK